MAAAAPFLLGVIGDSHSVYLKASPKMEAELPSLAGVETFRLSVKGASMKGFGRRTSTLNVRERITRKLSKKTPDLTVLVFGQVDVELGMYYTEVVRDQRVDEDAFFASLIATYVEFIDQLKPFRIAVKGINIPSLVRERHAVDYVGKVITENVKDVDERKALKAKLAAMLPDIHARTARHLRFNAMLAERCSAEAVPYFDINDALLNRKTGIIDRRFVVKEDNHVAKTKETRLLHWQALRSILDAARARKAGLTEAAANS